jgi:hypothetical protein
MNNTLQSSTTLVNYIKGVTDSSVINFGASGTSTNATSLKLYSGSSASNFGSLEYYSNITKQGSFTSSSDGYMIFGGQTAIMGRYSTTTDMYSNAVGGHAMYVDSLNTIGINTSLREAKINIKDIYNVNNILDLSPKSYNFRCKNNTNEYDPETHYGFIAEDVEKIDKNLCIYNPKSGKLLGIKYEEIIPLIINGIKKYRYELKIVEGVEIFLIFLISLIIYYGF